MQQVVRWFLVIMLLCGLLPAHAQRKYYPHNYEWTKSPWSIRYAIEISSIFDLELQFAERTNLQQDKENATWNRDYKTLFHAVFPFKDKSFALALTFPGFGDKYERFGYQVITFDREGRVLTPNLSPSPLLGREKVNLSSTGLRKEAVLVANEGKPGSDWYMLGFWFQGFRGEKGWAFSPALCHGIWDDERYGLDPISLSINPKARYDQNYVADLFGLIGCREWTWQLHRPASLLGEGGQPPRADGLCQGNTPPESLPDGKKICGGLAEHSPKDVQPYINVTTYLKPDKSLPKNSPYRKPRTFIGKILGWARFEDPPRPVIGKHGDYWLCLHECPDGEAPGIIPDIKAWTAKRSWPMPKPVPFFPDSKFRASREDLED